MAIPLWTGLFVFLLILAIVSPAFATSAPPAPYVIPIEFMTFQSPNCTASPGPQGYFLTGVCLGGSRYDCSPDGSQVTLTFDCVDPACSKWCAVRTLPTNTCIPEVGHTGYRMVYQCAWKIPPVKPPYGYYDFRFSDSDCAPSSLKSILPMSSRCWQGGTFGQLTFGNECVNGTLMQYQYDDRECHSKPFNPVNVSACQNYVPSGSSLGFCPKDLN